MKTLSLPLTEQDIAELHAGDAVLLSGTIYTARDCAHKRIFGMLNRREQLPFALNGAVIYYAGPCPAPEGKACGSCGPTTSARMNSFAPRLLDLGLGGMIGKGEMSKDVQEALVRNRKVYFAAIGGAGAVYGNAIKKSKCVAFPDLLSEAVYEMQIENFPLVVATDSYGESIYEKRKEIL